MVRFVDVTLQFLFFIVGFALPSTAANETIILHAGQGTVFCNICPNGEQAMGTGSVGGRLCLDLDILGRAEQLTFLECLDIQNGASIPTDPCGCGLLHPTPRA